MGERYDLTITLADGVFRSWQCRSASKGDGEAMALVRTGAGALHPVSGPAS